MNSYDSPARPSRTQCSRCAASDHVAAARECLLMSPSLFAILDIRSWATPERRGRAIYRATALGRRGHRDVEPTSCDCPRCLMSLSYGRFTAARPRGAAAASMTWHKRPGADMASRPDGASRARRRGRRQASSR